MANYTAEMIVASEDEAIEYATDAGYTEDVTRFFSQYNPSSKCGCGETQVMIFSNPEMENDGDNTISVAVCDRCAEW